MLFRILMTFLAFSTLPLPANETLLYGVKVSPFVRKVEAALMHKNVRYQNKEVLPAKLSYALNQEVSKDFAEASPLGKVPALKDRDFTISDSSVIAAYLEKKYPEKSLYPKDASLYAKALWFEKYGDTVMTDIIHQKIFMELFIKPNVLKLNPDETMVSKAISEELPAILSYLNKELEKSKTLYFAGNQFTIADIGVSTHLKSLDLVDIKIDSDKYPFLSAYKKRVFTKTVFKDF